MATVIGVDGARGVLVVTICDEWLIGITLVDLEDYRFWRDVGHRYAKWNSAVGRLHITRTYTSFHSIVQIELFRYISHSSLALVASPF